LANSRKDHRAKPSGGSLQLNKSSVKTFLNKSFFNAFYLSHADMKHTGYLFISRTFCLVFTLITREQNQCIEDLL